LRNGRIAVFALPRDNARPFSVAVDRDGNVWYADISGFVGMLPAKHAGAR
jgi:virginiamycin B lyase